MSILIIDEATQKAIKDAIQRARENPVPYESIKDSAVEARHVVSLRDRNPKHARPKSQHLMLGTYRASFSFEEQPTGLFRHLSVSSHQAGRVPGPEVMKIVGAEFGFGAFPIPASNGKIWIEEFKPGRHAVNIIERVAND